MLVVRLELVGVLRQELEIGTPNRLIPAAKTSRKASAASVV